MSISVFATRYDSLWELAEKTQKFGFSSHSWEAALVEHAHEPQEQTQYSMSEEEADEAVEDNQRLLVEARESGDRSEVPALLLRNRGLRQISKLAATTGGRAEITIMW